MASVRRRKDGWQTRYWGPDGQQHAKNSKRKLDADRFASKVEVEMMGGGWINPAHSKTKFATWLQDWEKTTHGLRPSTRVRDDSYIKTHILPDFGNRTLGSITQPSGSGRLV